MSVLQRADALLVRLYGSRYNPLYHSGAVTAALMVLLLVTGLYLLLFYRVGAPWESVARITEQRFSGLWIRTIHRYAADAAVVTALVHAWRMFAQRRSWGARTLPWLSGVALLWVIAISGWTGYVLVWDTFGHRLATEGARILDLLPLFSEPVGRAFIGEQPVPGAFFFLNLFLHIALPIGMGVLLMVHVSRVARAKLFPSRGLMIAGGVLLLALSIAWPVEMWEKADPFRIPEWIPLDVFYGFWLVPAAGVHAGWIAFAFLAGTVLLMLVPRFTRPAPEAVPPPSVVNERSCTGCTQCSLDCPYEAITMIPRQDGREGLVARVDTSACVSCGICAGSCAPMVVGPPGRTGKEQLDAARRFAAARVATGDAVVIACARGAGQAPGGDLGGAPVFTVNCAGTLHTSVIETLLRSGAGGVLVVSCPPEDCWGREGVTWLDQRIFHGREAELQERVDRRRILVTNLARLQTREALAELEELRRRVARLDMPSQDLSELDLECDTATAAAGGE
jgi:ferredoxin